MDPRLKRLLIHTIQIKPHIGTNADGEESYGDPVQYRARWEQKDRYIRNQVGDLIQTRHEIFLDLADISPRDLLVLPNGEQRPIFSVQQVPGRRANDHTVILA